MRTSAISARTCCGYAEVQKFPTSSCVYAMWALFLGQEEPCAQLHATVRLQS